MVECELIRKRMTAQIFLVLIDTWWNVNTSKPARYYTFDIVLIDTWWNVNLTSTGYVRRDVRSFNRYMVECEFMFI